MQIRPFYVVGSLVMVIVLCGIAWNAFRPKNTTPVVIYKATSFEPSTEETSQGRQNKQTRETEKESHSLEKQAAQNKDVTLETVRILRGTENDSYLEKLQKAMETPEYQEYLRKQGETFGMDLTLWWDFLESQGLGSARTLQAREFRERFPNGGSTDYEPEMRQKMAELSVADPSLGPVELLQAFWREDSANYIWTRQHFNGHVGDYDWAVNIHQNALSILAERTPTENVIVSTTPILTSEPSPTEGIGENSGTPPSLRMGTDSLADGAQVSASSSPLEEAFTEEALTQYIFEDIPELSSKTDFQKSLSEQFSTQRFKTAMEILTQYGTQAGLQRLKESDPEMASRVERLIQPNSEDD